MSKQENFLTQLGWDLKSTGSFDFNGLVSLLKSYEENSKDDFESISRKNLKYLSENHHPHTLMICESTKVELFEGVKSTGIVYDFIKD